MSDFAIRVEGLGKEYQLGEFEPYKTLRDVIVGAGQRLIGKEASQARQDSSFWALKDVSFEVKQGEMIGIIGPNGAGKSTLLKILSRITEPTEGQIELRGRVGSLLEVGTGFHPELTGRENIFLNGAILGMTRVEIARRFDEIVAFSEIEQFLDTPVKRYSSGMYVRLAFAVAAHLEPEILIVDEVLSVGDQSFQNKCLGKMSHVANDGRTILFVSHNMAAVEALCDSGLLLRNGKVRMIGETAGVIEKYLQDGACSSYDIDLTSHAGRAPQGSVTLKRLRMTDDVGATLGGLHLGQPATFEVHLASERRLPEVSVAIHISSSIGQRVVSLHSRYQCPRQISVDGHTVVRCRMDSCQLIPGTYSIVLSVDSIGQRVDRIESGLGFEVAPRDVYGTGRLPPPRDGVYVPMVTWHVGN
ncbi:MAG TPA: ABC transporter ATP-binding protein [Tepidisphaeraceae bacterium]|nr:ABC transporter ATP-binding protein [Tepidisphaeraceae bacterium]